MLLGEGITQSKPPNFESMTKGPNLPENRSRMALDFPSFRHHIRGWTDPKSLDSPIYSCDGKFSLEKRGGIRAEHLETRERSEGNTSDCEIAHYQP